MVRDDRLRAAFRLAEAEAQLERCQQTERAHLLRMLKRARDDFGNSFKDTVNRALKDPLGIDALKLMIKNFADPFTIGAAKILLQSHPDRPVGLRRSPNAQCHTSPDPEINMQNRTKRSGPKRPKN